MRGEVRTGALSFALCLAVVGATGCSSRSEPGRGGSASCETDFDCRSIAWNATCVSGSCQPSRLGIGGDPASPPAQGAVVESIAPTPGATTRCQASTAPFSAPANSDPVSGTFQTLNCDLTVPGCKPNANVLVDGDNSSVQCTVSGSDSFNVSATLSSSSVGFSVQGTLTAAGGNAFVTSSHDQHNLQDSTCDITIEPNQGEIKPGAIWATFNCTAFGDISTGESSCTATGKFLFENCGK